MELRLRVMLSVGCHSVMFYSFFFGANTIRLLLSIIYVYAPNISKFIFRKLICAIFLYFNFITAL